MSKYRSNIGRSASCPRLSAWYRQRTVEESNDHFLEITFEGGRFATHSAPVGTLAELGTIQNLLLLVARHRFKEMNPGRRRLPRGFVDAAQLHLVAVRNNCLTASLARPNVSSWQPTLFDRTLFEFARDLTVEALKSADAGGVLPAGFPPIALMQLGAVGRLLGEDEALVMRGVNSAARVTQRSREWIGKMAHQPVERDVELEGEVEELDDVNDRFSLRTDESRIEVPFRSHQRGTVVEAVGDRPITRLRVRGRLVLGPQQKMRTVEELDLVDHERAPEVLKMWARIEHLAQAPPGWLNGDGDPPSAEVQAQAREVLARLLVDHKDVARPKLYPTPDGGLQAEWVLGDWAAEAKFSPAGDGVTLEATNGRTGEDRAEELGAKQISADDASRIAAWLNSLMTEGHLNVRKGR
ncbi:MAG: hypothetical protein IPK82_03665 [Polyangiaceae bacterium]|nr:hypothetical protein [Polyangiaceae bacterium]